MSVDGRRVHPQPVDRASARLPSSWHHQTEDEVAAMYEYGFLCGLRAASAAMDRALHEATSGVDYGANQVVGWLVRAMGREVHKVRP